MNNLDITSEELAIAPYLHEIETVARRGHKDPSTENLLLAFVELHHEHVMLVERFVSFFLRRATEQHLEFTPRAFRLSILTAVKLYVPCAPRSPVLRGGLSQCTGLAAPTGLAESHRLGHPRGSGFTVSSQRLWPPGTDVGPPPRPVPSGPASRGGTPAEGPAEASRQALRVSH